ncbi:MAG: Gfo/Idh/MocA family oxidoreductase [Thermomicrobiales bacterium]|nr:Gfo/Idh/MocA family oxidoreductase [Thermomicrobiales bacterium]MCO5222630.1 Gfo/Idh/MocA family oxidoreductase [Thermomicrobiales bacterium]
MTPADFASIDARPQFPADYRPNVAIVGIGGIVKSSHLPAYMKYGIPVAAVYDIRPEATEGIQNEFHIGRVAKSFEEILDDPSVEVVDIATFPEHRIPLVKQALEAGKHVLSQKPLALDMTSAQELVDLADTRGLKLAVNQNGRWSPPWRAATMLLGAGAIGEPIAVTHLLDRSYRWTIGTHFEKIPHWAIYDYTVHWIDITRTWMGDLKPVAVRGRDYRTPNQPPESLTPWGLTIEIDYENGATALIRATGGEPGEPEGHPFFINGTEGKIWGSALGREFVELYRGDEHLTYELEGAWFPDGFGGTMGELLSAIAEDREPSNSARHNLGSLQLTLAAVASAEQNGIPIVIA